MMLFTSFAAGASPEKSRVGSELVTAMAQKLDGRLSRLSADDPVQPVGLTQGAYFPGIGVVFMGSVNLAPMAGITPFHQTISKQEMARIHQKKAERIPKLKDMMQDVLSTMAWSMDPVPADEQIAVAISLFYFSNEDTTGLPSQIVMRAQKKALIAKQAGAVKVDEF
jgi:hypothetical protein